MDINFEEFIELMKKGVFKSKGFPEEGISFLELKDDTIMICHKSIFSKLSIEEMSIYITVLGSYCKRAYIMGELYSEGLISPNLAKIRSSGERKTNGYVSFYEFDFEDVPEERIHESKELYDYTKIECKEKVFTYNKDTHVLTHAPALSEIHTEILKNNIAQKMVFIKSYKKYLERIINDEVDSIYEDNPFGDNKLKEGLNLKDIIKDHYIKFFESIYVIVDKQIQNLKSRIENIEGFGTFGVEQMIDDINNIDNKNNNNKTKNNENKSNEDVQKSAAKVGSLRDRIKARFNRKDE